MHEVKVKICGLKRKSDVQMCMRLGVDVIGFVTEYPLPVPWNLTREEASILMGIVKSPYQSCIVTGGCPEKVIGLASCLRPAMVQLHYMETFEDTIIISKALGKLNIKVIKTVPLKEEDRILQFGTTDVKTIVKELCKTDILALLADSRAPSNACEKGNALDLGFCKEIINLSSKPVIIGGGINKDNVCDIVIRTGSGFIDVMTGVEGSPGRKDAQLLSHLLASIRRLQL